MDICVVVYVSSPQSKSMNVKTILYICNWFVKVRHFYLVLHMLDVTIFSYGKHILFVLYSLLTYNQVDHRIMVFFNVIVGWF